MKKGGKIALGVGGAVAIGAAAAGVLYEKKKKNAKVETDKKEDSKTEKKVK